MADSKRWTGRTKCSKGHAFTPSNTIIRADGGGKRCRECKRLDDTARRACAKDRAGRSIYTSLTERRS